MSRQTTESVDDRVRITRLESEPMAVREGHASLLKSGEIDDFVGRAEETQVTWRALAKVEDLDGRFKAHFESAFKLVEAKYGEPSGAMEQLRLVWVGFGLMLGLVWFRLGFGWLWLDLA